MRSRCSLSRHDRGQLGVGAACLVVIMNRVSDNAANNYRSSAKDNALYDCDTETLSSSNSSLILTSICSST